MYISKCAKAIIGKSIGMSRCLACLVSRSTIRPMNSLGSYKEVTEKKESS
jgi:hypothetical protein